MSTPKHTTQNQNQTLTNSKTQNQNQLTQILNLKNELLETKNQTLNQTHIKLSPHLKPKIRSNYDYSLRVQQWNTEPSLTVQDAKDECDINLILARFEKTGVLEHTKNAQPQYGDFTDIPHYQESLNMALKAQNMFMDLPAGIRAKFQNDPMNFLQFANNPENQEAMIDMGLATRREAPTTAKTPAPEADPTPKPTKPVKTEPGDK